MRRFKKPINSEIKKETAAEISVKTHWGVFYLTATKKGLCRLDFPSARKKSVKKENLSKSFFHLVQAGKELEKYLNGKRVFFRKLQLDLSGVTGFEREVLKKLACIQYGHTQSYGDLARSAGSPRAARAVGSVMRKNRLPIILPCHRVVGSQGKLGGYSGGLDWKRRLLHLEAKGTRKT